MKVDFVTNLPLAEESGGWSAISRNIYLQLADRFDCQFIGPINPQPAFHEKLFSKMKRVLGGQGQFFFFSEKRLSEIGRQFSTQKTEADFTMFHGATPWLGCQPTGPYGAYIDAIFPEYMRIYSAVDDFSENDLNRIADREKTWLLKAEQIFFGSHWARTAAIQAYELDPGRCDVVWVGGNADIPTQDDFNGGYSFLFIALDFERKGGRHCVEAMTQVNDRFPDARLTIIGAPPPEDCLTHPGVEYVGFLNKSDATQKAAFQRYLAGARALVHPTSMDTMGMVLIEAGYYGCPSIASRNFGIPELVLEDQTGWLLPVPLNSESLAEAMINACTDNEKYLTIRNQVRQDCTERLSWDAMGDRFAAHINPGGSP